jgi:hypothetical protein
MRRTAVLTTLCHNSSSVIVCPKQQCTAHSRRFILDVLRAGLFLSICYCVSAPEVAMPSTGVTVQGPGVLPNLGFACCDQGIEEMRFPGSTPGISLPLRSFFIANPSTPAG